MRRRLRGATLMETMAAATVLAFGMVGIMLMLIRGAGLTIDSNKALRSTNLVNQHLHNFVSLGYDGLAAQVPAGTTTPVPLYVDQYTIDLVPAGSTLPIAYRMDASVTLFTDGGPASSVEVRVETTYLDWARNPQIVSMTAVITEKPDASF